MTYLYYASQNNSNFCEYQMFYLANLTISNNQFQISNFSTYVQLEQASQVLFVWFLFWKFRTRSSEIGSEKQDIYQ